MKKKLIKCMDCPKMAVKGIKEMGVGLCEEHANELLMAAILLKIQNEDYRQTNKTNKKKVRG